MTWAIAASILLGTLDQVQSDGLQELPRPGVQVRQVDDSAFPEITVDFELIGDDGEPVLDARAEGFAVTESGEPVEVLRFRSPTTKTIRETTVVLVVDRSGSMNEDGRIERLREAVAAFLEARPEGSRVAVVAFGSEVEVIAPFTVESEPVRTAVNRLRPGGGTRFYDAVAGAVEILDGEPGRRAIVALTDGEDTSSETPPGAAIRLAAEAGLPIYTVGVGSQALIAGEDLRALAEATRGSYFEADDAEGLSAVYVEIARSMNQSYSLTYRTNRELADGTLRPIAVSYLARPDLVGAAEIYIPGMVVPARGWSPLFLGLVAALGLLAWRPRLGRRRIGP